MSKWSGGEIDRVRTAATIARHGQSDKSILQLVAEQRDREQ